MTNDVRAIKSYVASNQAVIESKVPVLSTIDDDLMSTTLSASLMINAEASQPWSTIGFDQWIGAGKWWLLRAQVVLRTITDPEQSVAPAAYAALIKATWILVDVVPCHPQFPFIPASKSSELQSLSAEVKDEFSRITALAMVVPSLDKLRSQDLRLWESIPVKAPLIRPYRVSQNLNEWRVDGGEHVLFRGFAFHEVDLVTTSPCILSFLVHESAKAARLVAQDQYDGILRAIAFPDLQFLKNVNRGGDGKSVLVGKEKFVLGHVQEAQVLCNMIEAATFYILGRQVEHASLEDLKAYMLLTAIKNREEQTAAQIRQEIFKTDHIVESDQKGSLAEFAVSISSQWIKGRLIQDDASDLNNTHYWGPGVSLLDWAVVCNQDTLTEFLLSEEPVIEETRSDINPRNTISSKPLELSAAYGNELAVRWCLKHDRFGDMNVTESLHGAMEGGHANVVALLLDAGVHLGKESLHEALRSPLSELVVHAILAMVYVRNPRSRSSLQEAADGGHEGAIVLLSVAKIMRRSSHSTLNSGRFMQVVAALAVVPDFGPAFGLTLGPAKQQRTKVRVRVYVSSLVDVGIYLASYHAYIEAVPEGVSEYHKRAIKVTRDGEFSFIVLHQEEALHFVVRNKERDRVTFMWNGLHISPKVGYYRHDVAMAKLPIDTRETTDYDLNQSRTPSPPSRRGYHYSMPGHWLFSRNGSRTFELPTYITQHYH